MILIHVVYTVHCTVYSVQCTVYTVYCILYSVHYKLMAMAIDYEKSGLIYFL